ncbi:hypothetical protein TNCV_3424071 [Trichonephila clavipes]|nr:hypothetical protein TNCV_3424071 [Trichonephila clavipes]
MNKLQPVQAFNLQKSFEIWSTVPGEAFGREILPTQQSAGTKKSSGKCRNVTILQPIILIELMPWLERVLAPAEELRRSNIKSFTLWAFPSLFLRASS